MIVKPLNLQGSSCSKVLIGHIPRISAMCYDQVIYSVIWMMKIDLKILCLMNIGNF